MEKIYPVFLLLSVILSACLSAFLCII
jgi:hypothetical protein